MLGTGFGHVLNNTGCDGLDIPVFALSCMAALFAGQARALLNHSCDDEGNGERFSTNYPFNVCGLILLGCE